MAAKWQGFNPFFIIFHIFYKIELVFIIQSNVPAHGQNRLH